jgi:hypothetical protein
MSGKETGMKRMWSVLALACVATACSGSGRESVNPAGPTPAASMGITGTVLPAGYAGKTVEREIAATLTGRFDFSQLWGDEWWECYADSVSTGTVTHFGLSELRTRHIPLFDTGTLTEGEFTLVAANGDEITGTYEGTAAMDPDRPDVGHASATFVVTGGTGRFKGASGSITATALETFDDPTWLTAAVTWTLSGTVRY